MELTPDGEKLYGYTEVILSKLDEAIRYFNQTKDVDIITIYRIGGVATSLLLSGYYTITDKEFKMPIVNNKDVSKVVHNSDMTFIIADDKYMEYDNSQMKKRFLYHQRLLLSVKNEDPLAQRTDIDIQELENYKLAGRNGKVGFYDWIRDVQIENHCTINEVTHIDYVMFATEGIYLKNPFLMSSFGQSVSFYSPSFSGRTAIPVRGEYTERDIYLYYRVKDETRLKPLIALIESNAKKISDSDQKIYNKV